jgi:flagellar hook-associated protein 3 FlgL
VIGHDVNQVSNVNLQPLPELLNQLDTLLARLEAPDLSVPDVGGVVRDTLNKLDAAHQMIGGKIAEQGGAQNIIKMMTDNHGNVSLSNQQSAGELGRLDYAEAMISMNTYMLALQASQKAYGKVSQLTLFNVI